MTSSSISCKNGCGCEKNSKYVVIIGGLILIGFVIMIVMQCVVSFVYNQNKAEIDKLYTILNELLLFLTNITDAGGNIESIMLDTLNIVDSIGQLEGDITELLEFRPNR